MQTKNLSAYAPFVLRLTMSAVYVWFGVSQILDTSAWTGFVPDWATAMSGMSAVTIVHLNGWFELAAGSLLAIGVYTRYVAALLAVHLFAITIELGLSALGVRDFGLAFATIAVALYGDDQHCATQNDRIITTL